MKNTTKYDIFRMQIQNLRQKNLSNDRVKFFKLVHIFKIRHNLAPRYLMSNVTSVSHTHSYSTRGSDLNFHLSRSLASAPTTFAFTASKFWNELPSQIKEIESLALFKRKLKDYLFSRYN